MALVKNNRSNARININIDNGHIDKTAIIGKHVVLSILNAKKPVSRSPITSIGIRYSIGAFSIINEGTVIGDDFYMGDQAAIRENCVIGDSVSIGRQVSVEENVRIGSRVKIQTGSYITGDTNIEDDVFIGPMVVTANDLYMNIWKDKSYNAPTFKKGCAIGAGSKILPGVTIGEKAVIGMGSVVIRDVPAGRIYVGNPAHDIGPAVRK